MKLLKVIDYLIFILTIGVYLFFNQLNGLAILLLFLLVYRFYHSQQLMQKVLLALSSFSLVAGWVTGRYSLTMLAAILLSLTSFLLVLSNLKQQNKNTHGQKIYYLTNCIIIGALTLFHIALSYNVFNPDFTTSHTNFFFGLTDVPEKEESRENGENGVVYYRDLTYPSQLGNNKLDIYTTPNAKGTIFYIHGGGYAGDDKFYREDYLFRYVKDGYNVVNVNYLLAPKARYKDGLKQVNEALAYIKANAATFGIDVNKIVLSGDSAGGQLAGQLALVLTNKDYAKQINFTPVSDIKPKGYIGVSSWSDIQMGMRTGVFAFDWFIAPVARSYFQVLDVAQDERVEEASILNNVNKDFPASFISDGNVGSFTSSNIALVKRLSELGVFVSSKFYDRNEVELKHIFELSIETPYAQEIYQQHLNFLNTILGNDN